MTDEHGETRAWAQSALAGYGLPLLVGVVLFVWTLPAQLDRIAFDEVREGLRGYDLWLGNVGFWRLWYESVHPPGVPLLTSWFLHVLPMPLALRMPAVLAGFVTILLVVRIGRGTGRPEIGTMAGLLVAGSPIWWAYSCAISLDVPLAAVAALAALGTVGARRRFAVAVLALVLAALTKRQGPTLIGAAMLLAWLGHLAMQRTRRTLLLAATAGLCVLVAAGIWRYASGGLMLFGITTRLGELLGTSPVLVVVAALGALGLGGVFWICDAAGRRVLLPLALFTAPLALAPFVSSHPAPRYFLPALPTASLLLASAVWLWAGAARRGHHVAVSAALLVAWVGVQTWDLQGYWARQRGHRDAVRWLARHVPHTDIVISPTGQFLTLAAVMEGVTTAELFDIDRTTCARIEDHLERADQHTWMVLPLYRDFGWPPDVERHAAAMGLSLKALVRRDVPAVREPAPWADAKVESLGPPDGTPVLAILFADRPLDRSALAAVEPRVLRRFTGPASVGAWDRDGVEAAPGSGEWVELEFGGAPDGLSERARFELGRMRWGAEMEAFRDAALVDLPYLAQLHSGLLPVRGTMIHDWHHHRWLELEVRGDDASLYAVRLSMVLRTAGFSSRLCDLPHLEAGDGWRRVRVDLGRWGVEELSKVRWVALSAWNDERWAQAPRLELRQLTLMPDDGK